ncbi:MAG: AAA family ATPase [Phenylobacterium sp.]
MIKLKQLVLQNYCGYKNSTFNFTDSFNIFFGPNGCGKSNLLEAIRLLSLGHRIQTRDNEIYFRKLIYHEDYNPSYIAFEKSSREMLVNGIFLTDDGLKEVAITNQGVVKNEIPRAFYGTAYHIDADHPVNLNKFQLHAEMADVFLDMARIAYGFDCELQNDVEDLQGNGERFFTDFVIHKYGTKVHFKRFSAGEKKIATLLKDICNPLYINNIDIIVVDNVEMHIYFKRHAQVFDKLLKTFPSKQFFFTTHSGTLLDHIGNTYGKKYLFDLEEYKNKELANIK